MFAIRLADIPLGFTAIQLDEDKETALLNEEMSSDQLSFVVNLL